MRVIGRSATGAPPEGPWAQSTHDETRKVWWLLVATADPGRGNGPSRTARTRWGWWAGWGVVAVLSVGIALYSFPPYLPFFPGVERLPLSPAAPVPFVPDVQVIPLNQAFPGIHGLLIAAHAVPAGLALLVGPFQFVTPLRRRYPGAHRWLGRFYLLCVAAGSVTGLVAGLVAVTGFMAQAGFIILVALWSYSGWMAYTSIRKGQVQLHRVWMVRNFALTTAAIWLRLILIAGGAAFPSMPFEELYHFAIWGSVLGSLAFAEWFIVGRALEPSALGQRRS